MVLRHYLWLTLIYVSTILLSFTTQMWPNAWLSLVQYSPFVVGAVGLFISASLNRIQPLLVLFSITFVTFALAYYAPIDQESIASSILFPIVSFLLPLNLLFWALIPEKGIYNRSLNLLIIIIVLLQAFFVYWFMREMPLDWVVELSRPVVPQSDVFYLPFMSALTFLVAGFAISMKIQKQKTLKIFDHAQIFVLLLMVFALNQYQVSGVVQWVSTISMLTVLVALIFDSHHLAYTDELTGLPNRRALNETFLSLGRRYTIVMIDIDFFKQFNDSYGHDLGDIVLHMVGSILQGVKGGKAFRFGGEEFTLVFKNKSVHSIANELERLRAIIENEKIEVIAAGANKKQQAANVKVVNVTVSMGAAQPDEANKTPDEVLKYADEGLYKAKKKGRNRVVIQAVKESTKNSKKAQA